MIADRDLEILRTVVDIYVRDGEPVSSKRVKECTGVPSSTATLRNVMARLERRGLLMKPHASAGRVPTDDGYRSYVDHLESNHLYEDEFASRFRDQLRDGDMGVGSIMTSASRTLGHLSRNFAVVYGSAIQESRVRHIKLVDLEGSRLLVVVNLVPEYERTVVLKLEKHYAPDVVARVEGWINETVSDKPLNEAEEAIDAGVRDNVTDEGIIAREIAIHREDIFSEPPAIELYFEERGHVMDQPELSDPKLLQLLLRLMHNKPYLTSLLSERLDERTKITIGREHSEEDLTPFSLVTAGYRMGGARGVLGIIGPTRMRYDLVHSLVGAAARELQAIGEEYF